MKISIKTIKGEQFQIEAEITDTILALKEKIFAERSDFVVDRQKLIHSGKVLKDTSTVEEIGIKESEFLVCMVTKEVAKPAAARPAPATSSATTSAPTNVASPAATAAAAAPPSASVGISQPPATTPQGGQISDEAISMLTAMGFPESEARVALRAAGGNGNIAVEFLMNGIPEHLLNPTAGATPPAATSAQGAAPVAGSGTLSQLRLHPQFTQLQRLVQSNPAALTQVLEAIGQQDPNLLAEIHANHDVFVEMMNEPIVERPAVPSQPAQMPGGAPGMGMGGMPGMPGMGGMGGMGGDGLNPVQLLQMLQALPEAQRAQAAASMNLSVDQLQQFTQLLSSLPPDQLQNMMGAAGLGGQGGVPPGADVVRLTPEELAAVRRLQELGFSEQQAVQAFIACDRNETLAANFLFDGGVGDFGDGGDMDDYDEHY